MRNHADCIIRGVFINYDPRGFFSILKLAHRWDFPVVKDFAIRELRRREDEVPLVRRISLYQEYEAPAEFLVPLYAELCAREWSPTDDEVEELGYEQMYYVMKARETLRSTGGISPLPRGMTQLETFSTIENVFGLPQYTTEHEPENNDATNLPVESEPPRGPTKSAAARYEEK